MAERGAESPGRVRIIMVNSIRFILALAFLGGYFSGRRLVFIIAGMALIFTFVPGFLEKQFKINVPAKYEIMILLFIYGILFVGEVRGLFAEFWWWDILLNFVGAIALGFIGLSVMYVLYREKKMRASPLIIAFFAFSFALAMAAVWEIFEFALDLFLGFNLQKSALDTMKDLTANGVGALLISFLGYFYIRDGKINIISTFVTRFVERNMGALGVKGVLDVSSEEIKELIGKGEGSNLEFKSSLRANLHTKEIDKRIEHSIMKTITAYLNSDGGTLLVGVSDSGEVLGTEKDMFPNKDSLNLHVTNLIKNHIGNEFLPFIKFDLVPIDGKMVLKIECGKSNKHVFLKMGDNEEFYVRNGPSSVKLDGNSLVDYIRNNFMRGEW